MFKYGDEIRFIRDITCPASGDHPPILFARKGELGVISEDEVSTCKVSVNGYPGEFWVWNDEIELVKPEK